MPCANCTPLAGHTPGPWAFDSASGEVSHDDGDVFPLIAFVDMENTTEDQGVADGHLIAAAPELLNALKLALPYVDRIAGTRPTQPQGIMRRNQAVRDRVAIRAAIAKAEGR